MQRQIRQGSEVESRSFFAISVVDACNACLPVEKQGPQITQIHAD